MATWGKILTCDNLMKRWYTLVGWCSICRCSGETVNHLLLHCPVAVGLWNFIFCSFGINWVLPGMVVDLFFGWKNEFGKHSYDVWNLVPLCLMWTLWRERNWHTFEDLENLEGCLIELFATSLFDWFRVWGFTTSHSIADFIESL
jgi:hypothetical protein